MVFVFDTIGILSDADIFGNSKKLLADHGAVRHNFAGLRIDVIASEMWRGDDGFHPPEAAESRAMASDPSRFAAPSSMAGRIWQWISVMMVSLFGVGPCGVSLPCFFSLYTSGANFARARRHFQKYAAGFVEKCAKKT